MRKLFFMLLISVATMLNCQALTVNNAAGSLAQAVDDVDITALTVTGTMDARDFLFITDNLDELTTLDLSQVTIVPYEMDRALYGTVTKYSGNEIPRTAFFGKKLTTVSLPAGLESIGFAAFAGCYQLRSVTLPSTVAYIDDYAFAGTGLTSMEIPATVTGMGKGVFLRCEQLSRVAIHSMMVGHYAFQGDVALNEVQLGAEVKYIRNGAFNGCTALTTLAIDPACRLTHIAEEAFINSGLEHIDINLLGVGSIGDWALAQTRLSAVELPDGMTDLGVGALAHNPLLTTVVMPTLGHHNGRRGAPSHYQPLTEVKDYTFAGDNVLNPGMLLGEGIVSVGNYALYNVSAVVDTMRLPSTLTSLGDRAMAGMTGMKALKVGAEDVPALGNEVWLGVDQPHVPLITPSPSSEMLYKQADQWANFYFNTSTDILMGDVDDDGEVSVADLTLLIDHLLNTEVPINEAAADVDGDGEVTISDVSILVDILLTASSRMTVSGIRAIAAQRCGTTSDALSVQAVALRPGETRTIDVALANGEHDYAALQCELVLPQGVSLVGVQGIERGHGHMAYSRSNTVENNVYSLLMVSMDMAQFAGDTGNIMQLTVEANDQLVAGETQLLLTNVVLVTTDHERYMAVDAIGRVSDQSGIDDMTADRQVASVRYVNVAGQESNEPFDGMNIVVTTYTDGTTSTAKVIK